MTGHLRLFPSRDGEYWVWEEPVEGASYIIGADVAQMKSLGRKGKGDSSAFCILRRFPGFPRRLVQVAEGVVINIDLPHFGEILAVFGMHYNNAIVNIEKNLAEGAAAGLRYAGYPTDYWYQPPQPLSVKGAVQQSFFTHKSVGNQKGIVDTTIDYLRRGNLELQSKPLLAELRSLQRDARGVVVTRSKDRSVALMMAVIVDTTAEPPEQVEQPRKDPGPAPYGVDAELWDAKHGRNEPVAAAGYVGWGDGGLPEWTEVGPQGAD